MGCLGCLQYRYCTFVAGRAQTCTKRFWRSPPVVDKLSHSHDRQSGAIQAWASRGFIIDARGGRKNLLQSDSAWKGKQDSVYTVQFSTIHQST